MQHPCAPPMDPELERLFEVVSGYFGLLSDGADAAKDP